MRSEPITPPTSIASASGDASPSSARPASPVTRGRIVRANHEMPRPSAGRPLSRCPRRRGNNRRFKRTNPSHRTAGQAEPTPEERREITSRLSAAGAATGEITATLLWNGHGDLDLVVRCPSGRQLDYRNPAECGGTLDVDANASRANVSDRPVENVFWRAGKAAPGAYEIAVRYAPRKDEQLPGDTVPGAAGSGWAGIGVQGQNPAQHPGAGYDLHGGALRNP